MNANRQINPVRSCSISSGVIRVYRLRWGPPCASLMHAPGQNRLSFNSPSKAAVVLTGAGMAFIRYPSRAETLSLGVVSDLSKQPPTLLYVQTKYYVLVGTAFLVSLFVSPCLHSGVYFIAMMSQTLWERLELLQIG